MMFSRRVQGQRQAGLHAEEIANPGCVICTNTVVVISATVHSDRLIGLQMVSIRVQGVQLCTAVPVPYSVSARRVLDLRCLYHFQSKGRVTLVDFFIQDPTKLAAFVHDCCKACKE